MHLEGRINTSFIIARTIQDWLRFLDHRTVSTVTSTSRKSKSAWLMRSTLGVQVHLSIVRIENFVVEFWSSKCTFSIFPDLENTTFSVEVNIFGVWKPAPTAWIKLNKNFSLQMAAHSEVSFINFFVTGLSS